MHLIFRGDPIELERGGGLSRTSVTLDGVTFKLGVATDASSLSEKLRGKLKNNSHFEVAADAHDAAPLMAAPVSEADAGDEVVNEEEAVPAKGRRARAG